MGQRDIVDHLEVDQGASGPSHPPGSLSTSIVDTLLLSGELYQRPRVQDDYPYATSSPHGQVEGAAQRLVANQEQYATTQEASWQRERKVQVKKKRDKARKRSERSNNARDDARKSALLEISLTPRSTLARRSECLYVHPRRRY
jgi:hypothetical protein